MPSSIRMIFWCLVLAGLPFLLEAVGLVELPAVVPCVLPIAIELGAGVIVGWRAWTLRGRSAERAGWALLAAALGCWALADLVLYLLFGTGEGTSPDAADPIYFVFYLLFAAAIGALVRARMSGHRRVSILGEGLVAALGVATIATAALFGPVMDALGGGVASTLVTLAYPVCDVAVLCLACLGCSLTGWRPGRPIVLCCFAALAFTIGDSSWALDVTIAGGHLAAWSSVLWSLSALLLADAAWRPLRTLAGRPNHAAPLFVGFAFALVACTVMAVDRWVSIPSVATLCAVATIAVGLARTARLIRHTVRRIEHFRAESLTDGLTGLGNRRRLMGDLERVVATPGRDATLALFDLDGFKDYNDTFGHAAGDALLVRIAEGLTAAAAQDARAYRLGGDEFCVLLKGRRDEHDPQLQQVAAGFCISGEGFAIDASCGLTVIPDEADSAAEALRIADGRMYVRKESARPSNVRSARDVLVRALREREPELGAHIRGVADLSTAVGQRLGLSTEALEVLGRAAELHDVGKLAMPDRLLGKPTELDEGEWALMRCHPEIGARILAPVAALAPVAELVLASHERWDGSGYPAGLVGDAIPLGARIIAVCDVYDAMVTDLPYAPARQASDALAEITAAAGTQFDPAVVAAFTAELAVAR